MNKLSYTDKIKQGEIQIVKNKNVNYAEKIASLCKRLEKAEKMPNLSMLAKEMGLSPHYFHRIFKGITGLTPKAYTQGIKHKRMHQHLQTDESVTEAVFAAGYASNSRFYEKSYQMLGMTPSAYRKGGAKMTIRFALGQSSLGAILVAMSERGICAIFLGDDPEVLIKALQDRFKQADLIGGDREFDAYVAQVVGFVEAPQIGLHLPLDVRGTAFQQRVWQALTAIPMGETASYSDIAKRIGCEKAVRAVASACAANPLAVVIPCHRVVRQDGALSGYRWGVHRKRLLLKREAKNKR